MVSGREGMSVVVNGVRLAYEDRGIGRPVVFVHGYAASSATWRQVAHSLSDSYRTVALDLMGFGRSEKPARQLYTIERQASLLRGFLAQLDLDDFVLVGHSYGGGVCLSLLRLDHGLHIRGLALMDTICYPQPLPTGVRLLRMPVVGGLALRLLPAEAVVRYTLRQGYHKPVVLNPELVKAYAEALRSPGGRQAMVETARRILPQDVDGLVRSYARISYPTFILWGERDRIIPVALGRRLSGQIPGAASQMVVLKDCGHVPQEEMPERTAELIGDFLLRLSPHIV
jgi:pimeloyl-ACP methyl ester carboxylesterase